VPGASFSHHAQDGGIWPDGAGMPDPQPRALHQPSRLLSRACSTVDRVGPTSLAPSLAPGALSHASVSTVPRFQGQGRPPGQTVRGRERLRSRRPSLPGRHPARPAGRGGLHPKRVMSGVRLGRSVYPMTQRWEEHDAQPPQGHKQHREQRLGAPTGSVRPRRCMAGVGLQGPGGLLVTVVRSAPDRKGHTDG